MLRKLLKVLFFLVLVFAVVWLLVIGYWRLSDTDPSGTDLALYLGCLPIGMILVFLGVKAVVKRRKNASAESEASGGDASASADSTAAAQPEDRLYMSVLDTALRLPIGSTGEDALAVLADGKTRPGLDDELKDDQGFPVFAMRVEEVVDADLEDTLALPARHGETALEWSAEQMRALAIGRDVLDELLTGQLAELLALFEAEETDDRRMAPADSGDNPPPPPLRLRLFVPREWAPNHRDAAIAWFREHAKQSQLHPRLTITAEQAEPSTVLPGFGDLNDLAVAADADEHETVCILLACDSSISDAQIARLDGEGRLFSQANPGGVVPTEGAAGLLAVSNTLLDSMPAADHARVHRAAAADRHTRADGKSRGGPDQDLLGRLAAKALANAQCQAEDVACIVSDAGVGTGQTLERAQLSGGDFTHLDPTADCPSIGTACGDLGTVGILATVGLGRSAIQTTEGPVLAASLSHPYQRAAVVLQPPPEPADPSSDESQPAAAQA